MNAYTYFFVKKCYNIFFFSGISKEGPPSRHLLPTLAISRPSVAPRIKSSRALWLCFSSAKGRSLCQSLSLHKNRSANSAASSRTYKYKKQRSKFQNSGLLNSIRFLRRPRSKKPYKQLTWIFEKISCKSTNTVSTVWFFSNFSCMFLNPNIFFQFEFWLF